VYEEERDENKLWAYIERSVRERRKGKGRGRERVEVSGEEERDWGNELHHNPRFDAVDREDTVGCSEPAKRCIVHKGDGAD
jgi:hypothetical protein